MSLAVKDWFQKVTTVETEHAPCSSKAAKHSPRPFFPRNLFVLVKGAVRPAWRSK